MYSVRLMFEWGGGCLWADDAPTREGFEVGPLEAQLPLPAALRDRLDALSARHDGALNWLSPADPGPWSRADHARFDAAAMELLGEIALALGPQFRLRYQALGA